MTAKYHSRSAVSYRLGLVSDALGRERAIEIIRSVLDSEGRRTDPLANNDGAALKILLALGHALDPDWRPVA